MQHGQRTYTRNYFFKRGFLCFYYFFLDHEAWIMRGRCTWGFLFNKTWDLDSDVEGSTSIQIISIIVVFVPLDLQTLVNFLHTTILVFRREIHTKGRFKFTSLHLVQSMSSISPVLTPYWGQQAHYHSQKALHASLVFLPPLWHCHNHLSSLEAKKKKKKNKIAFQ